VALTVNFIFSLGWSHTAITHALALPEYGSMKPVIP
jgi:hypothetical protein